MIPMKINDAILDEVVEVTVIDAGKKGVRFVRPVTELFNTAVTVMVRVSVGRLSRLISREFI